MAEKLNDNVGKKIVEALKMQNKTTEEENISIEEENINSDDVKKEEQTKPQQFDNQPEHEESDINSIMNTPTSLDIDSVLQNAINENFGNLNQTEILDDFEYPNNVAILNHLISKLPAGVTRQTGAVIIKQTMEALGIPMKSVIREAQQVQESLANRTKECQKNIIECKKQISILELKTQKYQKQSVIINDMINLFMSTGI